MSSSGRPLKKQKIISSSLHLPDDIITQILVKISCPEVLLRCTSVCKSWYSFINSPLFINLHLHGAKLTKFLLCLYETNEIIDSRPCLSIQYESEAFVQHSRLVFPSKIRSYKKATLIGCCNGLICYKYCGSIHLWNPAIRRLRMLPEYPNYESILCVDDDHWLLSDFCLGFGFWFDQIENDYMVALISYTSTESFVDIYSLSSNSWRIVSHSIPGTFTARPFRLQHVAGTLHWPAKRSESFMIYSLDIKTGMFRETLLPIARPSCKTEMDIQLTAFGENSLAVSGSKIDVNNQAWHCLIVLVYDQNMSKLYTIDLEKDTCHVLRPMVGFRNNGEPLFPKLDLNNWGIVSCNIETKDFEEFVWDIDYDVRFVHKSQRVLRRVQPFIETLVLLNDRHAVKIETDFEED